MTRPKHPKKDENHHVVIDALEALGKVEVDQERIRYTCRTKKETIIAMDISSLPGQIDWLLMSTRGWFLCVEVKQPGKDDALTDGEWSWLATMPLSVIVDGDTMISAIKEMG